jgi:hypothetical protein
MRTDRVHLGLRDWLGLCFLAALVTIFAGLHPVASQIAGAGTSPGGQGPTGATSLNGTIPDTSTQITLTAPSSYITVTNTSSSTTIYFSEVNPASSSNYPIPPMSSYNYQGVPLTSFWIIGSANSGTYGVLAH